MSARRTIIILAVCLLVSVSLNLFAFGAFVALRSLSFGTAWGAIMQTYPASVRRDPGASVALGRRLSDRVYLFLERGISAATTALIIEYSLTRELRLRAEAGDVNGLGITWGRTLE